MSVREFLDRFSREGCCGDPTQSGYVSVSFVNATDDAGRAREDENEEEYIEDEDSADFGREDLESGDSAGLEVERKVKEETGKKREADSDRAEKLLRPPRKIAWIFLAATVTGLGVAAGVAGAWFFWEWQSNAFNDVCQNPPSLADAFLNITHPQLIALAIYCEDIRTSRLLEAFVIVLLAVALGSLLLRLSFGKAYFSEWRDTERLGELERLYSVRSMGGAMVLHVWRARVKLTLFFDVVVMLCFRYYLDLYLDVLSMQIFISNNEFQFLQINIVGIALGIVWTCADIWKILLDKGNLIMPLQFVLLTGFLMPLGGLHVLFLTLYSLNIGRKHEFLFVSTLAESVLESSISAFVQTYSVVFSVLKEEEKITLYQSIGMSFVSIGVAFSSLDKADGGMMLIGIPGHCTSYCKRMITVTIFRIAEVTSRATSMALFQLATRPYGVFYLVLADGLVLIFLTFTWQYIVGRYVGRSPFKFAFKHLLYAVPSVVCLMAPMIEKDCVLTIPPSSYYLLRFVELLAMFYVVGRKLKWNAEAAHAMYDKDMSIIIIFIASTSVMFVLALVIRGFLRLRVMLEGKDDLWYSQPFSDKQIALRNRILVWGQTNNAKAIGDKDPLEGAKTDIIKTIKENQGKWSWELFNTMKDHPDIAQKSVAEWEDLLLRVKVGMSVEKTVTTLEEAAMEHLGRLKDKKKKHTEGPVISSRDLLRTGVLVQFYDSGHRYVTANGRTTVQLKVQNENSSQKFLVEPIDPLEPLYKGVSSGDTVRLRSLENGCLLGFVPYQSDLTVKTENKKPKLPFDVGFPPTGEAANSPETAFCVNIVYQQIYRSARSFVNKVKMMDDDSLEVLTLKHHSATNKPRDWEDYGWEVLYVNGKPATRSVVDSILKEGSVPGSAPDDMTSEVSFRSGGDENEIHKGEWSVVFKKSDQTHICFQAVTNWRNKVMLHSAGGTPEDGWRQPYGVNIPRVTELGTLVEEKKAVISKDTPGSALFLEMAEYENKDDSYLYSWAANLINTQHAAIRLQASLAEKYRMAVVVGFNARTLVDNISKAGSVIKDISGILHSNRELHLVLLFNLSSCIREDKVFNLWYDSDELYNDEFSLKLREDGAIIVDALTEMDNYAADAGLQPGDELLELEIGEYQETVCVTTDACAKALELGSKEPKGLGDEVRMYFKSKEKHAVDNDVVRVAVQQARSIAPILPSWDEIFLEEKKILRREQFFEMKCAIVTSLLTKGWENPTEFYDSAVDLHKFFHAAGKNDLDQDPRIPEDNRQLVEGILVSQLDVLTASWNAVPRVVKDERPDLIRLLFITDHEQKSLKELQAMKDGVEIVFNSWQQPQETNNNNQLSTVRMPEQLKRFFMRVLPDDEDEGANPKSSSLTWLRKALPGRKDKIAQEVESIISYFNRIHVEALNYWKTRLVAAHRTMEDAEQSLESCLQDEDVKIVLVPNADELKKIEDLLVPQTLTLKDTLTAKSADGSTTVPKGFQLLRQGQVEDKFGADSKEGATEVQIHRQLSRLAPVEGDVDLRLMFSSIDFKEKQDNTMDALNNLEKIIPTVRHAAEAFEVIRPIYEDIAQTRHKAEAKMQEQVNRRKLRVKQKEADEALKQANARERDVRRQRDELIKKNEKLDEDVKDLEKKQAELNENNKKLNTDMEAVKQDRDSIAKEKRDVELDLLQVEDERKALKDEMQKNEEAKKEQTAVLQQLQSFLDKQSANLEENLVISQNSAKGLPSDEKAVQEQKAGYQEMLQKIRKVLAWT